MGTKPVITRRRSLFTAFSSTAVDELRAALAASAPALIPQLQELVREHLSPRGVAWRHDPHPAFDDSPPDADTQRFIKAMVKMIECIDVRYPLAREREPHAVLPDEDDGSIHIGWANIRHELLEHLDDLGAFSHRRGRGRPADVDRHSLAEDIATLLRLAGVPLTTSRSGTLAVALEIVLTEAYGSAPEDQFRLIQKVVGWVNDGSLEDFRRFVLKSAYQRSNPDFWLRLVSVQ